MTEAIEPRLDREIITITIEQGYVPAVDIGDMDPLLAYGALSAALQTINLLIPHCDIDSNGKAVLRTTDMTDDEPFE